MWKIVDAQKSLDYNQVRKIRNFQSFHHLFVQEPVVPNVAPPSPNIPFLALSGTLRLNKQ